MTLPQVTLLTQLPLLPKVYKPGRNGQLEQLTDVKYLINYTEEFLKLYALSLSLSQTRARIAACRVIKLIFFLNVHGSDKKELSEGIKYSDDYVGLKVVFLQKQFGNSF